MRIHRPGLDMTFEAAADLSALQFTAVKFSVGLVNGQQCTVTGAGAGERGHGILQNKPTAAGLGAVMRTSGYSKFKVDGSGTAIAAGDPLKLAAGGVGVKAVTDKDHIMGFACEASVAAGDIIELLVNPFDLAV